MPAGARMAFAIWKFAWSAARTIRKACIISARRWKPPNGPRKRAKRTPARWKQHARRLASGVLLRRAGAGWRKSRGASCRRSELVVHHFRAEVNARIDGVNFHVDALRLQHLQHDGRAAGSQRKVRAAVPLDGELPRAERRDLYREGRRANRRQLSAPPALRTRIAGRA